MNTEHKPLRSSMSLFTNMVKDRHPWGIKDILREKKRKEQRSLMFASLRPTSTSRNIRFAVAKKQGSHYHIVGVGKVQVSGNNKFAELKSIAKSHGFTHLRFGAIKTAL
jgi:hypothetical protein